MSKKVLDKAFDAWEKGELKAAFECFKEAAESGEKNAMQDLGYFYDEGIGTGKDKQKAMYWYKMAVKRGDYYACVNIGILYMEMDGNKERARYWFEKGVVMGDCDAYFRLAKLYLQSSRENDRKKAVFYLKKLLECDDDKVIPYNKEKAEEILLDLEEDGVGIE